MSRFARKKEGPSVKPVEKVEISDKNRKLRIVAIALLLALGGVLIATSVANMLTTPPGWETIQVGAEAEDTCAGDFVFLYLLGEGEQSANLEQRAVAQAYTQATTDAFQLFHEERLFGQLHNVAYLNQHPNEVVDIPEALYKAFQLLADYENRALFAAPIYKEYVGMFLCEEDWSAELYASEKNSEQAAYFAQVLAFTGDPNAVSLELLGNNRVKLAVSQEYLQFASEKEISAFIDFYWMKNAFIADYLAEAMTQAGYIKGTISSFDGFCRNLDSTDRTYEMNIFDRVEQTVYHAGTLSYSKVKSFVTLRNYPTSSLAVQLYYQWSDGSYTSCHIDPADGKSKAARNDLMGYSRALSCGEVLMQLYPVYVTDTWNVELIQQLPQKGVETAYSQYSTIYTSDKSIAVNDLFQKEQVKYTWQPAN